MNSNLITALAGVLGSVSGTSAAIATTWVAQKGQTVRERAKSETRQREILYGDFITEAWRLLAYALDHSLGTAGNGRKPSRRDCDDPVVAGKKLRRYRFHK